MSDGGKEHTQVLLPTAQISLFSSSDDTIKTFLSLEDDWRFARIKLETKKGDVEAAAAHYDEFESPELVIIETEEINDTFTDKLEKLGANCTEGTAAMVIGPVNDVNLYRKLIGMGVSDYVVRPITKEQFGNDIAATILDKIGERDSRLIAFIGSKGGVGTSALSQIMAWSIADSMKQKALFMDSAAGWSSMSVGMDFEPTTTLSHAVRAAANNDDDSLTRMLHKASDHLSVLATGSDIMLEDNIDPENLEALLDFIMITYPVLIVDLSCSAVALKNTVLSRAHEIVLVSTPTLPSLRLARTLLQEISGLRGDKDTEVDLVINMLGISSKYEVAKSDIEAAMERKPTVLIPFSPDIFLGAESKSNKVSEEKGGDDIADLLLPLATKVLTTGDQNSDTVNDDLKKGGIGQLLQKLKTKS